MDWMDPAFVGPVGLFVTLIVALVVRGPIGQAIGERIRHKAVSGGGATPEVEERLDQVAARLDSVQQQLGDLAERQDFTERLLTRARERGLLEAPK